MKQAVHIFRKDVRHLWPQISVAIVLVGGHAVLDVFESPIATAQSQRVDQLAGLVSLLLVLAWWNLMAAAIQEEALPGDRQFWVTRPYSWKSLLGAKVLFVVAFVNAPLLVSDCLILGTQGFPVFRNVPDLLLRQFVVSGWLILPAAALATVTSGIGQFVLALLLVSTGMVIETITMQALLHPGMHSGLVIGSFEHAGEILLILVLLGGTLWQFTKRQTGRVRWAMAVTIFALAPGLSAIPWPHKQAQETRKQQVNLSELRLSYDLRHPPSSENRIGYGQGGAGSALLPVVVSGLPEGTALVGVGEVFVDGRKASGGSLERTGESYFQQVSLDRAALGRLALRRVSLRSALNLTIVSDEVKTRVRAQQGTMAIPGVGFCAMYVVPTEQPELLCRSGVRAPAATLVRIEWPGFRSERAEIGNRALRRPLEGGLSPVEKWMTPLAGQAGPSSFPPKPTIWDTPKHPEAVLLFIPERPLAKTKQEFGAADVDLSRYF